MDFEKLTPESKRAAFAHMDRKRLGTGARHKKLSAKQKGAVEHEGKATLSGKLGSGSVKGKLSPADQDRGSVGGRLPIAKARPSAPKAAAKPSAPAKPSTPDTPEGRFEEALTGDIQKLTAGRNSTWAELVELRKTLDARGFSREEQDAHLKRMSGEGKLEIVPEDNRKSLKQEDHDAALRMAGEDNHFVGLAGAKEFKTDTPKPEPKAPSRSTDPAKLAAERTPEDHADLAQKYLEMHGSDGLAFRIKTLERRQAAGKLGPGQRAQLAALKSLGKK